MKPINKMSLQELMDNMTELYSDPDTKRQSQMREYYLNIGKPSMCESIMRVANSEGIDKIVSPRNLRILKVIDKATPGMSSEPMQYIEKCMKHLIAGGMVILSGRIGNGKTFAALAGGMAYRLLCPPSGRTMRQYGFKFIESKDIISSAFTENPDEIRQFKGCLIVDDLGVEFFKRDGFGIERYDTFFNHRYTWELPTIITTNLTEDEFRDKYNLRILDRLKDCAKWINLESKSLRGATKS